jgi:hypothetical protein
MPPIIINNGDNTMQTPTTNPNALWKYSDLARYLQVSEHKLRHDVM